MPILPEQIINLLNFIGSLVCHQKLEKTLIIEGRFLPVCTRCTGAYLGLLIGYVVILFRKKEADGPPNIWAISLLSMPMVIDAVTQALGMRESTNLLRLITGLFFGVALLPFMIYVLGLAPATRQLPPLSTIAPKISQIDNIKNPWITARALLLGVLICLITFLAITFSSGYSQPHLYWVITLPTFFSIIIHIFLLPALIISSLVYHFQKSHTPSITRKVKCIDQKNIRDMSDFYIRNCYRQMIQVCLTSFKQERFLYSNPPMGKMSNGSKC